MEDQNYFEISNKKRMLRKTHQDFRNKFDRGKLIQTELGLAAFWNAQRFGRWTDSGRGASALDLRGFPHAGLGKHQLFLWSCQCSLYFLELWSTTSCCHSSPDLICVFSTQPDCHISSFLCHIRHYPLLTSYGTHTVILEQYNSICPSYTM